MRAIALSGWGQAHSALERIAPFAECVDYAAHAPFLLALQALAQSAKSADIMIGWSMGGHMAVQAIAKGMLKPRKLVLIGVPYQFVKSQNLAVGMGRDMYAQFRDNFAENPERTLRRAHLLVAKGDRNAVQLQAHLEESRKNLRLHAWLAWLEALAVSTCEGLDFTHFPATLILHGENDAVVDASQAALFARAIPQTRLELIKDCGHAPHWHDEKRVRKMIENFCHV